MLSYRTLFNIRPVPGQDVVQSILGNTFEWLGEKGLSVDGVVANKEVAVADHATVKWIAPDTGELAGTQRLILTENGPSAQWVSTVTVRHPAGGRPWFWMDVEGPEWAGAPRLVRSLLEQYPCSERGVRLTKRPVTIYPQQVDELITLLSKPGRRTLSFVAGSSSLLPLQAWAEFVGKLLLQTAGQASGYVLDPAATLLFNQRVGADFGVQPGMLRTYHPELNVHDSQDAARHRFLTADSIASQHVGRLRKTLSYRAREIAQTALLDESVRRLDRQLDEFELRMALPASKLSYIGVPDPEVVVDREPGLASKAGSSAGKQPTTAEAEALPGSVHAEKQVAEQTEFDLAMRALSEEFAGGKGSLEAVEDLRRLLEAGRSADALNTRLLAKMDQKSASLDAAEVENARLRMLVDDLELDAGETWEQLEAQYAQTRSAQAVELKLRAALAKLSGDVDWAELDKTSSPEPAAPQNFNSLVGAFSKLSHLVFTGDENVTADLDSHDAIGRWCGMTWSILLALNDYARFKAENADVGGVHSYLEDPPPGGRTYPPNRHARAESESVKNNPAYAAPRTLPVPTVVDPSGEAFMGAHFRIAKHGLVSPRLHYLDATAIIGKVIVGYIGPHLPNTQTN